MSALSTGRIILKPAAVIAVIFIALFGAGCTCDGEDDEDDTGNNLPYADDTADDDVTDDTADDSADDTVDDSDDTGDDDTAWEFTGFVVASRIIEDPDYYFQIVRLNAVHGEYTVLCDEGFMNLDPAVSPDGQTVVFASDKHYDDPPLGIYTLLYQVDAAGGAIEPLTGESQDDVKERGPVFSPDGSLLAYERVDFNYPPQYIDRLWLFDMDTKGFYPLFDDEVSRNEGFASFSPDGTQLVYWSDSNFAGTEYYPYGEIFIVDLDDTESGPTQLTTSDPDSTQSNGNPFFDSTGEWIYFESGRDDGYALYKVSVAGGEPILVLDIGITDAGPNPGMNADFDFSLTYDFGAAVYTTVRNGVYQAMILDPFDPATTPVDLSGTVDNLWTPIWWRP